jgi:hypothetical protein
MPIINYDWGPRWSVPTHKITPTTEMVCLVLSVMAIPVVLAGFGVYKISEFVSDFFRRETWV